MDRLLIPTNGTTATSPSTRRCLPSLVVAPPSPCTIPSSALPARLTRTRRVVKSERQNPRFSGGVAAAMGMRGYPHQQQAAVFTAAQWAELEQQALIYKYLMAGAPVPPDLLLPIRPHSAAATFSFANPAASPFYHHHHPALSYYAYYRKKLDPEPWRCRRTDGKKWRCSKEAHPDSKYCERHMHRGRNRSRKPVESKTAAPAPQLQPQLSTVTTTTCDTVPLPSLAVGAKTHGLSRRCWLVTVADSCRCFVVRQQAMGRIHAILSDGTVVTDVEAFRRLL